MKLKRIEVRLTETWIFAVPENLDVNEIDTDWAENNQQYFMELQDEDEIEVIDELDLSKTLSENELASYNRGEFNVDELQSFFGYGSLCSDDKDNILEWYNVPYSDGKLRPNISR